MSAGEISESLLDEVVGMKGNGEPGLTCGK